jgi:hypothetical protein
MEAGSVTPGSGEDGVGFIGLVRMNVMAVTISSFTKHLKRSIHIPFVGNLFKHSAGDSHLGPQRRALKMPDLALADSNVDGASA